MRERPGAVYGNGKNIAAAAAPRGERKALCGQMENAYRGHCSENGDSFLLKEVGMEVTLLTREDMARTFERLAYEVLERHHGADELLLVGIQRRGVDLARRLARILGERVGRDIPLGTLDINLYRDDWTSLSAMPALGASSIPLPLEGRQVILVDDVLYTGRTVRAALEGILDYGRPNRVELLVLVDRGHRELPIHADYVGRSVNTSRAEQVNVLLEERDGVDEVRLTALP